VADAQGTSGKNFTAAMPVPRSPSSPVSVTLSSSRVPAAATWTLVCVPSAGRGIAGSVIVNANVAELRGTESVHTCLVGM
jgi:hypothetical protein